jgi:uncharacterized protein YegL
MKEGLTELVFILDRSGSMSGLEPDTIGGYNSLLENQKQLQGEAYITTVLFDDQYELLHDRIDLRGVEPITEREYFVRGTTALLDAIGRTLDRIRNAQKNTRQEQRAENVMFVITTDGMENSSREYSFDRIKAMIETQKEEFGWEFLFIGANIDAIEAAGKFGIAPDRAVNYSADRRGVEAKYSSIGKAVGYVRRSEPIRDDWKSELEEDNKARARRKKGLLSRLKKLGLS